MMLYLGLGTNLGDKEANLRTVVQLIKERIGELVSLSSFYVSEPWGFESEHTFLNAVCGVETRLQPIQVLAETQAIERELGRTRKSANGIYSDRLIDIDILMYDNLVMETPELSIPHPLMCKRHFVMEPLAEIAPELIHPVTGKKMKDIL